jgi:hypothetical protein
MISAKEQFLKELPDLLWAARTLSAALDVWERGKTPNEDREKQIETAREIIGSYYLSRDDEGCCNTFVGKDLGDE